MIDTAAIPFSPAKENAVLLNAIVVIAIAI